ncbi:MAG: Glu/Leu/Phe/Val dehydrogenase [Nitrospiraceae bacterium]
MSDPFDSPAFHLAVEQLDAAAHELGLEPALRARLARPQRTLLVSVPVRMDDGRVDIFDGYRVQHDSSRGPCKGGIRFHPGVELGEVAALSMWMTWKCALMGIPYGGAKGGVRVDAHRLSAGELERLTRRYTTEIASLIGPRRDVPAPDVGTDGRVMAWLMDTYSQQVGHTEPAVVTGKPLAIGGSIGREDATGRGVTSTTLAAMRRFGIATAGATVAVQGFGNVGSHAARLLSEAGLTVIAVSQSRGGIYNPKGLPMAALWAHAIERREPLDTFPGAERISNEELLRLPCTVLVPAALSEQITGANADGIRCRILAEGANGPTTLDADRILADKGICVIPDILANAGGVTVSYFEWVQNLQGLIWTEQDIHARLNDIMIRAFGKTFALADSRKVTPRLAALMTGVDTVARAHRARGI